MDENTPDVLRDFWTYCKCYEITRNMSTWAMLGGLAAAVNRKVYLKIGDIKIFCNLYILLVGEPGTGKSTAMDFVVQIFRRACPEIPIGPSKQSHGDIIKFMSGEECLNYYTDEKGIKQELRVYVFFIDEFKNFVAYDIIGMISFLTGIYSVRDMFNVSTIVRGREDIKNPSLSFIACENPSWMIRHIKNDSISDGLGRRVIICYETQDAEAKPQVIITPEAQAALLRVTATLEKIKNLAGEFKLTKDAQEYYNNWYVQNREKMKTVNDLVYKGYLRSKHIQGLKVAMLRNVASGNPTWLLSREDLVIAFALLDLIEPNIPRLFQTAGRNELAAPQQRILDLLESHNGILPEREVLRLSGRDLNPSEQNAVIDFLKRTQQIYRVQTKKDGVERWFFMNPEAYKREGGK
jgi:hypothetical protein